MAIIKFGTDGWRARIAEDYTYANVEIVTQALADYIKTQNTTGTPHLVIGYDRRFLSEHFAARTAEVLAGNGVQVMIDATDGPVATPATGGAKARSAVLGCAPRSRTPPRPRPMAQLTLRDIASNEEIVVPPEGFVFGRAGGDADIQLDDATIAKRQARISSFQGRWVLEVMVVPPGQRLPKPQPLQEGQTFYIGESEFEVVALEVQAHAPQHEAGGRLDLKSLPCQETPLLRTQRNNSTL